MKFCFDFCLTPEDYLEYNRFTALRSPYGKKQLLLFRIVLAVIVALFLPVNLLNTDPSEVSPWIFVIPSLIVLVIFELLLPRFISATLSQSVKRMVKSGKLLYNETAKMEFFEDIFCETTEKGKSELKYDVLERVSIIYGKYIYLYINGQMACILPQSVFSSAEEYEAFIRFISEKCAVVDKYMK